MVYESSNLPLGRSCDANPGEPTGPYGSGLQRLITVCLMGLVVLFTACDSSSPTEPCPGPMNVGGNVTSPQKISAPAPQYTEEARQARTQGVVIVQAIIDCQGLVADITVLQGLPNGLTEAAVAAIWQWRFEPARLDGRPVSVFFNLSVNFRIQ